MGYRLREVEAESKFSQTLGFEALAQVIPLPAVKAVLEAEGVTTGRERKLNFVGSLFLVILMNLYTRRALGTVMQKMAQGLRYIWPNPDYALPKDSAISTRRYQLGVRPLVALFHQVCRPMTTGATQGAFAFGLRLMGIDGTVEDVPDTPANRVYFGHHASARGASAFPQVRGVYLVECGSHGIVEAGFWPCRVSERVGGFRVLRAVTADMLVMWDRGFHDFEMVRQVRRRAAHVLSRLPAQVKPAKVRGLPDGTCLAYLKPSDYARRQAGEQCLVRIIEYTLTDPALPGYQIVHRLLTTLLDPEAYPALELVCLYHERWEVELVIDEVDTHQRLAQGVLRSLKPLGVLQELYGLVLAHYAVRFLMHAAAVQAKLDPDQLSFVRAVEVLRMAVPEFQQTAPDQLGQLYVRLLRDMAQHTLPERRCRTNPRVVKRKMSKFHLKRTEHAHWPQPTQPFRQAVALI